MPDSVRTAQVFLENLYAGDFTRAVDAFGTKMHASMSDQALGALWKQMTSLFGKPLRHVGTRTTRTAGSKVEIVYLSWDFEKDRIDARMVVDSHNKIAGLSFETPMVK